MIPPLQNMQYPQVVEAQKEITRDPNAGEFSMLAGDQQLTQKQSLETLSRAVNSFCG